jgi:hypothetical protein
MIADYNGWTDLPEAEREALDIPGAQPARSVRAPEPRAGQGARGSASGSAAYLRPQGFRRFDRDRACVRAHCGVEEMFYHY